MAIDSVTREIISDCLTRVSGGDNCALFDLASVLMAHADAKDIELNLAVVEALALASKREGCDAAGRFLGEQWDGMKQILRKRWARNGFSAGP